MPRLNNSIYCIYYNILSCFYIIVNNIFPYYDEEILRIQYKIIQRFNGELFLEYDSRKRKRFNSFVESLIDKNNELIEKIKLEETLDNDIDNYQKITDQEDETEEEIDEEQQSVVYNENGEDEDYEEETQDDDEEHIKSE